MRKPTRPRARDSSRDAARRERQVLRRLCHARLSPAAWKRITATLSGYVWQDTEHALVYAAIERLSLRDPAMLREELPAQATRMGFPDIDLRPYFSPEGARTPASSAGEIELLLQGIKGRPPKARTAATKAATRPD